MNKENTVAFRTPENGKRTDDVEPAEKKVLLDKGQFALKDKVNKIEEACPSSPLGTALMKRKREFSWRTGGDLVLRPCENWSDV